MANLAGFNAAQHGEMRNFDAFAPCKALAMIVASEIKPNSAGTGSYLKLEFNIVDGPDGVKGRKWWNNLNISNANKTAEDIANAELSAICKAVGILTPQDSVELHNKPMVIDFGYTPEGNDKKGKFQKASNFAKGYAPVGPGMVNATNAPITGTQTPIGFSTPAANGPQLQAAAAAPAMPATPPWGGRAA